MEPIGGWSEYDVTSVQNCTIESHADDILKPLVRRRLQHQRDLAHSLVGTPNYIAPEVLARTGTYLLSVSPDHVNSVALLSSVARRHTSLHHTRSTGMHRYLPTVSQSCSTP